MVDIEEWNKLNSEFEEKNIKLIAVSKTKPIESIHELYDAGQRDFGENYVQELTDKHAVLSKTIKWHFIGHLQSNKVKFIAPFVYLIHAVDSYDLLTEINKYAHRNNRSINVLLQMHIADEETKFGMNEAEILAVLEQYKTNTGTLQNIKICGLMGMATNTTDEDKVRNEYKRLYSFLKHLQTTELVDKSCFNTCSMGMSSDYKIAIEEGSNMVRIGSLIFGSR